MTISWITSDGKSGLAEDEYEHQMQMEELSKGASKGDSSGDGEAQLVEQPSAPTMHDQLSAFQQRLDNTPLAEASELQKFLGSLNIMPAPGKPQEEWTTKEHIGAILNTAIGGMGGGIKVPKAGVSWPEGWGTTKPTTRAVTDYPHVQQAFKDAVESGAKTTSEITDHMNLNGTTINPSSVQILKKKAGLSGTKPEAWSEDKHNTFMNLIKEGKTTPEISEEMGLTRSTVEAKIRRIKEDDPTFERNFAERDTMSTRLAQVRELADQGLHANAIADKIGKSGAYVRMLASTGDISLPRDPKSLGGGARKKAEKGEWQKALQDRLNR